jgi:DNA-binding MarR family transcriptional regulator
MGAIESNPATDQARVAELIGFDRATIGGVISRLENKGLVKRVVSSTDRRARELSLTAKGKKLLAALQPIVKDLQQDILAPLSDKDKARFIELAQQVVRSGSADPA